MHARHHGRAVFLGLVAALIGTASFGQTPAPMPRSAAGATVPSTAELRPGDGIGGVDVVIRKRPGGQAVAARTDSHGNFTFANLPAGIYDINVTRPAQPNPTAKSFFESRSNTAKVEVTIRSGKSGDNNPLTWTWAPASGELVAGNSLGAMRAMSPPAGQGQQAGAGLEVGAGNTVAGRVTAGTVVKSKSNIIND